jgi:hypothetical protein
MQTIVLVHSARADGAIAIVLMYSAVAEWVKTVFYWFL